MDLQYEIELYEELLENYVLMLQAGQIDENEFEQLKAAAYVELQERLADASEIDEDALDAVLGNDDEYKDEDGEDYSYGDLAEFSAGSQYGSALLELADAAGYDDLESFIEDVAAATGNDPSDIFDLVTGEAIPDDNFSVALAEALGLDEDLTADLLVLGIDERGEDIEDYLNSEDDDADYDEEDETYSRVAALETELAEFQYENAVKDNLAELLIQADNLVEAGCMPPIAAEILFGSFDLDSDRIAAFSAVCNQNSVTPDQELYAMRKTLEVFERLGGAINFGYSVQEEFAPVTEEDVELEQIAANYIKNNFRK